MSEESWLETFGDGYESFLIQDFGGAFKSFNKAIRLCNDKCFVLHDARATAYESLSCSNYALRDAQKAVELAPTQWQGYFRSARLLASQGQSNAALKMCAMALWSLGSGPLYESRRRELTELRMRLQQAPWPLPCHISSLPVELLVTVFRLLKNPAVITLVCHQWRALAHSHPTLWSGRKSESIVQQ